MGYFGESGTKVTWANPQKVPEGQRQNGGWYYNPDSGRVDRWWNDGDGPRQQQQQQQQQSQPRQKTYEDYLKEKQAADRKAAEEQKRRGQDQLSIWNQFMKNPNFFDEMLANRMEKERSNRYYSDLLKDFSDPLNLRKQQGAEKTSQVLEELVRRRNYGEASSRTELEKSLEQSGEGFAGAGLYGSGLAKRGQSQQKIKGEESIQDFLAKAKAQEEETKLNQQQQEQIYNQDIAGKQNEYFGEGRELDRTVSQNVSQQRSEAKRAQQIRALESIQSKYGNELLLNIPDYLMLT